MKSISIVEFRKRIDSVLKQVEEGHPFILTHRGKPVARLEPMRRNTTRQDDPIYSLAELAAPGGGPMTNKEIDELIYEL